MNQYVVFAVTFNEASNYHNLRLSLSSTIYTEKIGDKIFLRDRYTNIWPVKVKVIDGDIHFLAGWKEFAKHNYLEDGDVIVFYHGGTDVFDIKILGRDSSDKKGIGRRIYIGSAMVSPNESDPWRAKADEHQFASSRKEKSMDPFQNDILKFKTSKICPEPYLGRGKKAQFHGSSHALSKKEKFEDPLGHDLFKNHPDKKPKNSYFVTWWRKDKPNSLFVPMGVAKYYKLRLPKTITLQDSEGRTWNAELRKWKDGRQSYVGGLRYLCRRNCVKPEDSLVCELLRSERKDLHSIRVHTFHP